MRTLRRKSLLCLAALFVVRPAAADPRSPSEARVALDRARARYAEALDRASYRVDDPALRAVADEVTVEALSVLEDAPGLDNEVRTLLREAAGAALGPWLRQRSVVGDALLAPWLREHDDPAMASTLTPHDPLSRLVVAQEVALRRPELAAELITDGIRASNPRLGEFCAVAAALPEPRRRELATLASSAPHAELFGECLALIATQPSLRLSLAHRALSELERAPVAQGLAIPMLLGSQIDDVSWPIVAAVLVAPDIPLALSRRIATTIARRGADLSWTGALAMLESVAPSLRSEHPAVASLLSEIDRRTPGSIWRVLPVPDRSRVTALAATPVLERGASDDTVREVALSAPRDGARAVATLRAAVSSAASGGFDGRVSVRSLLAWIESLERTARCEDDACLRHLVRDAADETAARAAWLLGAQGLTALPTDDARALVRRLVMEVPVFDAGPSATRLVEASSLARVVYGTLRACPASLAGLSVSAQFGFATYGDPVAPWRRAFALRCRDARAARSP